MSRAFTVLLQLQGVSAVAGISVSFGSFGSAVHAATAAIQRTVAARVIQSYGFYQRRAYLMLLFTSDSPNPRGAGAGNCLPSAKRRRVRLYAFA